MFGRENLSRWTSCGVQNHSAGVRQKPNLGPNIFPRGQGRIHKRTFVVNMQETPYKMGKIHNNTWKVYTTLNSLHGAGHL